MMPELLLQYLQSRLPESSVLLRNSKKASGMMSRATPLRQQMTLLQFTLIILDKGDRKFYFFATNESVDAVLAYNLDNIKGAEGFAEEYRAHQGRDCIQRL